MTDMSRSSTIDLSFKEPRRLPVGIGLSIGAGSSVALWILVMFGLRALLL